MEGIMGGYACLWRDGMRNAREIERGTKQKADVNVGGSGTNDVISKPGHHSRSIYQKFPLVVNKVFVGEQYFSTKAIENKCNCMHNSILNHY
jgi:hypothetical protein